ncbi:MAG: carotenoid biosynthesis protein [Elusimicrobiales bacterium]|nr:carotenoid biosynthesis protein [Elusimicrobiales bacterium]
MEITVTPQEKRIAAVIAAGLGAVVLFSSVLHHFFPWVLDVPSIAGLNFTSYPAMFLLDLIPISMGALCFYHAYRTTGIYKAMMFLGGSFFFTGLAENVWVLMGRYRMFSWFSHNLDNVTGTYYFTRAFFWWGEMPMVICLGWFFIAYACVHIAGVLLPRASLLLRAALGGFLAMSFDLWMDPVQVSPMWKSWVWVSNETIKVFSIPLSNFMGWFLFIFIFAIAYDRLPRLLEKHGTLKGTLVFFLTLLMYKVGMMLVLMAYGALAMKYVVPPVNFTLWGI